MRTAVMLTSDQHEAAAVLRHVVDRNEEMVRSTLFHVGRFCGVHGDWRVAIAELGAGNVPAAVAAERATFHFNPEVALFVGTARGIKDVGVGDVVIGTVVHAYESGKVEDGGFRARPKSGRSSETLIHRARAVVHKDTWQERLRFRVPGDARTIHVGPIAAGEKLIASAETDFCRFLHQHYNDTLAVELEGYGFLEALALGEEVRGLVIRGVSGLVRDDDGADPRVGRELACDSAAAVAFEVLAHLPPLASSVPAYGGASAVATPPVPIAPNVPEPEVTIGEIGPGEFMWCGAVSAGNAGHLWKDTPPVVTLRVGVPHACPSMLRNALLRLLCHVHPKKIAVMITDVVAWSDGVGRCLTEHVSTFHDNGARGDLRELDVPLTASSGRAVTASELAEQIENALDACTMTLLNEGVVRVLQGDEFVAGFSMKVESNLAAHLEELWDSWKDGMDAATRRHFLDMLAAAEDRGGQSRGLIGIGRQTVHHCLVPATVLALALALCGDGILHPHCDGPLKPHHAAPGNLASATLRGHSSGARRVKGKPLDHWLDGLGCLPWQSRIVVLAGSHSSHHLARLRGRPIGSAGRTGRITDGSLAAPVALAFDRDFSAALEAGHKAVEAHLRLVLRDLRNDQAEYLKALADD